jgi:hypothetical protein
VYARAAATDVECVLLLECVLFLECILLQVLGGAYAMYARAAADADDTGVECVLLLECILLQVLGGAYASAAASSGDAHGAQRETTTETDRQRERLEREREAATERERDREREREAETETEREKQNIETKAIMRVSKSLQLPRLMNWILNARDLRAKSNFSHANVANKWYIYYIYTICPKTNSQKSVHTQRP